LENERDVTSELRFPFFEKSAVGARVKMDLSTGISGLSSDKATRNKKQGTLSNDFILSDWDQRGSVHYDACRQCRQLSARH
jgi:hypothetical protein